MEPVSFLTPSSSVKGKLTYIEGNDKPAFTYLGIPFAEPPIGDLRLQRPVPKKLWDGELEGTTFGPAPLQALGLSQAMLAHLGLKCPPKVDEDCLYLNVYTPTKSSSEGLPVMVWFYGGGFGAGFTDPYLGTSTAVLGNVVLVTIAYRVGLFGFFSTGDETCRGNFGLWDQIEGMKWVKQHIRQFGGDPDNITLYGESAGGISISFHHLISESRNLFHKAILMSGVGSLQGPLQTPQNCQDICKQAAKAIGMSDGSSTKEVFDKIKGMSAEEIVEKLGMVRVKPCIDGVLLTQDPDKYYGEATYQKTPAIFTVNTHEGHLVYNAIKAYGPSLKTKSDALAFIKMMLGFQKNYKISDVDGFAGALMEEYLPQGNPDEKEQEAAIIEILTDVQFTSQVIPFARMHSRGCPSGTFLGVYGYRFSISNYPSHVKADHGDDIPIVFGIPLLTAEDRNQVAWTDDDKSLSRTVIDSFTSFARTGKPTGTTITEWPSFDPEEQKYLYFDNKCEAVSTPFKAARMNFWSTIPQQYR